MYINDDNHVFHIIPPFETQLEMCPDGRQNVTIKGRVASISVVNHYHDIGLRMGTLNGADRVIYNNPATIVYWKDGTKTVVKCDPEDEYNPMTGLALCYMKKFLGNNSRKFNDALHDAGF